MDIGNKPQNEELWKGVHKLILKKFPTATQEQFEDLVKGEYVRRFKLIFPGDEPFVGSLNTQTEETLDNFFRAKDPQIWG